MTTTVKEVRDFVFANVPSYDEFLVGDLEYVPRLLAAHGLGHVISGAGLVNRNNGTIYSLADEGFEAFCRYMGMPAKFLDKMPEKMSSDVVNYFIDVYRDDAGVLSHFGGSVAGVYKDNALIASPYDVVEMIGRVFEDEDKVSNFVYNEGISMNVQTTNLFVDARMDDRTNGGIRFQAFYGKNPRVSSYMERLVCSNGMVATDELDTIAVKGRTMSEIIGNMQHTAERMLRTDVPAYLRNWQELTRITTTNPEQLIHRLARENELSGKLESNIIEAVASLTGDTYYDIVNLVTNFQHLDGVDDKTSNRIQVLGGNAVRDLGGHRCNNCQHNLDF